MTVGGLASNGVSFTVTVPPSITSLSPTSGPVGTAVTITGTQLRRDAGHEHDQIQRDERDADELVGDEHRRARARAGATSGTVVVTVGGLASNGVSFTVTVPPSITSLSPTSGPVGTAVTITGSNFGATQGTSTIRFNGDDRDADELVGDEHRRTGAQRARRRGTVVVTVGGLASNGVSFTVTVPPSITSLSPTSGPVGMAVTITGINFGATQGTSTIKFNGTTATPTSWSATGIVVPVPAGATSGNVVVTVGGLASNGVSLTVTVPPEAPTGLKIVG